MIEYASAYEDEKKECFGLFSFKNPGKVAETKLQVAIIVILPWQRGESIRLMMRLTFIHSHNVWETNQKWNQPLLIHPSLGSNEIKPFFTIWKLHQLSPLWFIIPSESDLSTPTESIVPRMQGLHIHTFKISKALPDPGLNQSPKNKLVKKEVLFETMHKGPETPCMSVLATDLVGTANQWIIRTWECLFIQIVSIGEMY